VAALVLFFGRTLAWRPAHKLALAAGAALSYAWHAFIQAPVLGGTGLNVRIGNAIFALGAVLLIAFAAAVSAPPDNMPGVASCWRSPAAATQVPELFPSVRVHTHDSFASAPSKLVSPGAAPEASTQVEERFFDEP